ncbi:MAG: hypothetical protein ACI9EW_003180 [Cellvibrionaceae bacterium]|jgi:hypothetical protein
MNFDQIVNDTPPHIEAIQIKLLTEAGQIRRSRLMLSLTQSAFSLSRHNLRQKFSDLSELEQNIKFVELLYGPELALSLQTYLEKRSDEQ